MINIPTNDYVEPTAIREEVVEHICDALLHGSKMTAYHDYDSRFRTLYVSNAIRCYNHHELQNKSMADYYGINNYTRIRTSEIKKAFEVLVEHGWFIYRYSDRDEITYCVRKSGTIQDKWLGRLTKIFSENIDN